MIATAESLLVRCLLAAGRWAAALQFPLRIESRGQLPAARPVIFAGNHCSEYDAWFALPIIANRLGEYPALVAWPGLRELPILRRLEAHPRCPAIVVAPDNRARALWGVMDALGRGSSVYLNLDGAHRAGVRDEGEPGAALAALRCRVPIVPFVIQGTETLSRIPFARRISMDFLPAIDPGEARHLPLREGVAAIQDRLRKTLSSHGA
jgi:1-acyl-sn-glycerol-3-phosphate acyltransferase